MHGSAGSLGLYVQIALGEDREASGFLGAAHVLSNMNRAGEDRMILSPGAPPEAQRREADAYGRLHNARVLVHHTGSDPDQVVNPHDAAVAVLNDIGADFANRVADPNDRRRELPVDRVLDLPELRDHSDHGEVFLSGRSTPFAAGRLIATDVREFPIRMSNGRNYVFENLCVIERAGGEPFSRGGDSGALVYALEKMSHSAHAVAFVVGGNDRYTFATPAMIALEAMEARLHDPRF
jgi:hypothetical protein